MARWLGPGQDEAQWRHRVDVRGETASDVEARPALRAKEAPPILGQGREVGW